VSKEEEEAVSSTNELLVRTTSSLGMSKNESIDSKINNINILERDT
jgi:hypothetical protein